MIPIGGDGSRSFPLQCRKPALKIFSTAKRAWRGWKMRSPNGSPGVKIQFILDVSLFSSDSSRWRKARFVRSLFFSGASWLFAELAKIRPKGLKPFASLNARSLRSSQPKKSKCHFAKGPLGH
jgi:hypothetical protein